MEEFNIFFSDLTPEAQKRLLDYVGASDSKEMNWDMDILPIATFGPVENDQGGT